MELDGVVGDGAVGALAFDDGDGTFEGAMQASRIVADGDDADEDGVPGVLMAYFGDGDVELARQAGCGGDPRFMVAPACEITSDTAAGEFGGFCVRGKRRLIPGS